MMQLSCMKGYADVQSLT